MSRETPSEYVRKLPWKGQYFFSYEDFAKHFPDKGGPYLRVALKRLSNSGKIVSPWSNFYVVMPAEYALLGKIPPVFYIDALMRHLGRSYYICLLNAAAIHGSSHQSPQSFSVMVEAPSIRNVVKNGTKLNFYERKNIPALYVEKLKTQAGDINVSSPLLTALDLVRHETSVGGLSRVATVLDGLVHKLDFTKAGQDLFDNFSMAVVQRLGYILDIVLGEKECADFLYRKVHERGFRRVALKSGKPVHEAVYDAKWKIWVNQNIEIDE